MDAITERVIRTDIEMQVAAREGQIHLLFNETDAQGEKKPAYTPNFLLSAADALTFSSLLADLAFEIDTGLRMPEARKAELVQRHRSKLLERFRVVLNSTREKRTISNASLSRQLVDILSHEVFD